MNIPVPPEPTTVALETRIVAVTVYTDQALITRRGTVMLTGEERALTLTGLPLTLKPESVRVSGTGNVTVNLRDVQAEQVFAPEPVVDRIAQLTAQIEQLNDERQAINDRIAADSIQRNFIEGLSEKAVDRFSRSLAQQQVSLAETGNLLNFVGQRYSALSVAIAQHKREQTQLDKQIQALHQQLQQIQPLQPKASYQLTIRIAPSGTGEFVLEVSYVCDQASWKPLYDLRVNSAKNRVHLTYLAEVTQTTGEDWSAVALALSTAKPGLGTLPPKLTPWYVDLLQPLPFSTPAPIRSRNHTVTAATPEDNDDGDDKMLRLETSDESNADQLPIVAEIASAKSTSQGGVVTFAIDGNNNIPGNGASHKITVFSDDYPCHLEYIAIPKLVSFAYLQAIVTNPADGVTLLPGQANIFRDNRFVGTTLLQNVAPGQAFKLNLGIDEGLKITRDLIERKVDKQLIGGQRRITVAYRLVVTNLCDQDATLSLTEQLPVSRNEQIKVRLNRTSPQMQLGEMGHLEWLLYLQPNVKQELSYQFTVEHPPTATTTDLDI